MSFEEEGFFHDTSEAIDQGKHGKAFEFEIAKYVFKRLLDRNYESFAFTREKSGLGKFDDLVVLYNDGKPKCSLYQLKHIESPSKTISFEDLNAKNDGAFSLTKYFSHYVDSLNNLADADFSGSKLQQLLTIKNEKVQSNFETTRKIDSAELTQLVICTNIGIDDQLEGIEKIEYCNNELSPNPGKFYKLKFSNKDVKETVFENHYLSDQEKLADELVTYLMSERLININTLKKDNHVSLIKTFHVPLSKSVIDTNTKKLKEDFFTSKDDKLIQLKETINKRLSIFYRKHKNLDVKELQTALNIKDSAAEIIRGHLKRYESAGSAEEFLKSLTLTLCKKFGNEALDPDDTKTLDVKGEVNIGEVNSLIDKFLNLLIFAVEQMNVNDIVKKELDNEIYIKYDEKMRNWYDNGIKKVEGSKKKREWITKRSLIFKAKEYEVMFQGEETKLRQLVSDEKYFSPTLLMGAFCSVDMQIGAEIEGLQGLKEHYFPRKLVQCLISPTVLQNTEKETFLISDVSSNEIYHQLTKNLPKSEIIKILNSSSSAQIRCERISSGEHKSVISLKECSKYRFVFVVNDINGPFFEAFVSNADKDVSTNVHWLKCHRSGFVCKATHGSIDELKKHITAQNRIISEQDLSSENQLAIICGEPGMGKSSLLLHLTENTKFNKSYHNATYWVINIRLKDSMKYIADMTRDFDMTEVISFVCSFQNPNIYSKELLRIFLSEEKRVVLLLDGFDELFYNDQKLYKVKVLEFLRTVKRSSNVCHVIVSTRFHCKEYLESGLSTFSHSLKELDEEEQVSFLARHWGDQSRTFAKNLIKKFNSNINNQERIFLGVPLQIFMLAQSFDDERTKENPVVPEFLHLTDLFERFFQTKYELYRQKCSDPHLVRSFASIINVALQNFAIYYGRSLTQDEAKSFAIKQEINFDDINLLLGTGIICTRDDQIQFVHKVYSEYLIAKRLVLLVAENYKQCMISLSNALYRDNNRFLLYLFDLLLTEKDKFPLHYAVLRGEFPRVQKFDCKDINALDCMGRCLLYYSLQNRHSEITSLLIDQKINLKNAEHFLKVPFWRYLHEYYQHESRCNTKNFACKVTSNHAKLTRYLLKNKENVFVEQIIASYYNPGMELQCLYYKFRRNHGTVTSVIKPRKELFIESKKLYDISAECPLFFEYFNYDMKLRECLCHFIRENTKLFLTAKPKEFSKKWTSKFEKTLASKLRDYKNVVRKLCGYLNIESLEEIHHIVDLYLYDEFPFKFIMHQYHEILVTEKNPSNLASMVKSVREKAKNMAELTKRLFACKIQCSYFISKSSFITIFHRKEHNSNYILWDTYSIKKLKGELENSSNLQFGKLSIKKDCMKIIEEYKERVNYKNEETISNVLARIFTYELGCSEAWALIDLYKRLHYSVAENNVQQCNTILKEASAKGWVEAVLNACNHEFDTALDIADNKNFKEMQKCLESKQREVPIRKGSKRFDKKKRNMTENST